MSEVFFTSDTHFGHNNILVYEKENRPFDTVEEMNEKLIDNWNDTVKPKDIVYHLGDFSMGNDSIAIAKRLNGRIYLVMGNHDSNRFYLYVDNFAFHKLYGAHHWKRCILTHIPVHPSTLGRRYLVNVHGHLHSKTVKCEVGLETIEDPRYFNVSVERHDLRPVHCSVVLERIKE